MKIAIIGYSGHSYVCIESALNCGYDIVGYYDFQEKIENPYQISYLGNENDQSLFETPVFVSIGDNYIRRKVSEKLQNVNFCNLFDKTALISKTAAIGNNTFISSNVVINAKVVIEEGVILNTGSVVEHECHISKYAHIAPGAVLTGNVKVGENTLIGAGVVVAPGITIGANITVGAGAVVVKDLIEEGVYVGNPAKKI